MDDDYDMDMQDWLTESLEDYMVCDEHTLPVNVVVRQDHFEREHGILF